MATSTELLTPGIYLLDPSRSSLTFTTKHLFGLGTVRGSFTVGAAEIQVAERHADSVVRAEIDARSFDTGNKNRDRQVRSKTFLATDDHPVIRFRSRAVRQTERHWLLDGLLTVRGAEAPLQLTVTELKANGTSIVVSAEAYVDRYAYGVTAMKGMAGRHLHLKLEAVASPTTRS